MKIIITAILLAHLADFLKEGIYFILHQHAILLAHLAGSLATLTNLMSVLVNKKKYFIILVLLTNILFAAHFFLFGTINRDAINGGMICLGMCFLSVVAYRYNNSDHEMPEELILTFIAMFILLNSIIHTNNSHENNFDFLITISSILTLFALNNLNFNKTRIYYLISAALWIVYDLSIPSYENIINQILLIVSIIVGYLINEVKIIKKPKI